jgi:hypothetical protein
MKEEWLFPNVFVPVNVETTSALLAEIKRLIFVAGDMALNQQREWVGLTEDEQTRLFTDWDEDEGWGPFIEAIEAKLKEKNT